MPAEAFAFLSDGTVRHVGRCWRRWLFPVVSSGGSVHPLYRSQLSPVAAEVSQNGDGMLALAGTCCWASSWLLLSTARPGAQHANAGGMSRQCGQCQRPECSVSSSDARVSDVDAMTVLLDQPFASSEMGDSMDADLLPELSGETWVAATLLEGLTAGLFAGIALGCSFLPGIMCCLSGPEISMPMKGSHGTCRCRPPMGSGGYGSIRHVCYRKAIGTSW